MRGAIVRDRQQGHAWVVAEPERAKDLEEAVARDLAGLRSAHTRALPRGSAGGSAVTGEVHEEEPARFLRVVEAALEAIGRGDVYQANLSRRWRAQLAPGIDEGELYRRLRAANPAPFAGIARLPGFSVLSSSPERLISIENGIASTRPIAGTRPRGRDAHADAELRADLRLNEKERAEHVMLVDLERNDLGRICRAGSVQGRRVHDHRELCARASHRLERARRAGRRHHAGTRYCGGLPWRHDHRLPEGPLHAVAGGSRGASRATRTQARWAT